MASAQHDLWRQALALVQETSSDTALPPWLCEAAVEAPDPSKFQVRLPDGARLAELDDALKSILQGALEKASGHRVELEFRAAADPDAPEAPALVRVPPRERPRLNPASVFENFVTGPCNRLAHAAALAVSELPGRAYNPLFIHASVGLGKSHLLQAICHRILENRPDANLMYVSCEDFINRFIAAVERGNIEDFRYRFRHLDVLMIDDIHFLADKDRTQEEFFHTFNTLYQSQKQVILSSDSPPHEIPSLEERLVSRFKWGLVVRIDRPSFETRVAIVQKKAKLRGRELPDEVVQYIANVVDSNNRELEGAVVRTLGYASLCERQIDLDLAKEALGDLIGTPQRTISIQEVTDAVLKQYNVRLSDLQGKRRSQSVTLPRQVCMYLARRLTNRSLEEIGAFFGGRDHTTVLYGERKIHGQVERDPVLRGLVESIEREIVRS
jgi:chromosomal replication initiator protein